MQYPLVSNRFTARELRVASMFTSGVRQLDYRCLRELISEAASLRRPETGLQYGIYCAVLSIVVSYAVKVSKFAWISASSPARGRRALAQIRSLSAGFAIFF